MPRPAIGPTWWSIRRCRDGAAWAFPARSGVRGGSAGGTTTLLALAGRDVFASGANLFGVTDLVALMSDDHKFESRYTISLIGPWPEAANVVRAAEAELWFYGQVLGFDPADDIEPVTMAGR